ncbi:release factor glutamine methyltransferase [Daejeonella rubra]|uniref:Release factor glutamine methyltransferase n=1 Tax=Daejeonella rubra TaxID=990371 RepID=A0A1G9W3F3_9SPHI|nr:peptide chain release factor N(5)-glutamine methyltransferase [Daejeonella rubra]SDM78727.1 release factor glutamine methyltransferase [Daejeonella rubra]
MTFIEAERKFIDALSPIYGPEEAKSLTWLSISFVCKLERAKYLSIKQEEIPADDAEQLFKILEQLIQGRPLQYILGETEFYDLIFKVNPDVLIPRPETEELVDWALITIRAINGETEVLKILDIGTGSACIPVSIKKYIPLADITAIDISESALNTARQNADLNQTDINFVHDDILKPSNLELINTKYDLILSNPPYVTNSEKEQMLDNVLKHEPHTALFVPDIDPLLFYRAIADFALNHLKKNGFLFLEINEKFGQETVKLLNEKGFIEVELRQDMGGKDRMIRAVL